MNNCVFCKIIKGEFSSYKIFEDEKTFAFLDIAKDVDYHILVVPKKHVNNIIDCDEDTLTHLFKTTKLISNHLVEKCGFTGVNLLNASGSSAGQSVPHFHIHIIPRCENDGIDAWPKLPGAKKDLNETLEQIKIK